MHRTYCRIVSVVFLLFTAYPLVTKLIEQRLAHDWLHSALHLASALLAAYAGWRAAEWVARLYVAGVAVAYGALGTYGWFTTGLFLGTPLAIPLGPVENVFHLLLGVPALGITLAGVVRRRASEPATP
jgi:hypothetical protein